MLNEENKKEFALLAMIFIIAFFLRIAWFYLRLKLSPFFLGAWNDDYCYNNIAQNMISGRGLMLGEGLRAYLPPVYPLFLSLIYLFFNDPYFAIWVQTALSALSCVVIYLLAREIFSRKEGILAALFAVISPFFIIFNSWLLTESLCIFILAVALLCMVRFEKTGETTHLFYSGLLLGLSTLTRPQTVFFVLLFIFWLVIGNMRKRGSIKILFSFVLGFLLIMSPWIIRNYFVFGKFVPLTTHGGITFYHANNPLVLEPGHFGEQIYNSTIPDKRYWDLPEVERDKKYGRLGLEFMLKNLRYLPKLILYRLYHVFSPIMPNFGLLKNLFYAGYWAMVTPFSIIGLCFALKRKKAGIIPLALLVLGSLFLISFYAGYFRLRASFEIPLIIFAAHFWAGWPFKEVQA